MKDKVGKAAVFLDSFVIHPSLVGESREQLTLKRAERRAATLTKKENARLCEEAGVWRKTLPLLLSFVATA